MKQLVLAEKPSVGRDLARTLGAFQRAEGYLEGPQYIVTWALGHLVELSPPASYDSRYRRWHLDTLPILPTTLTKEVMSKTRSQFMVVKELLQRTDLAAVIIATDAGREGELVARWILELAGYEGTLKRLWISSQTNKAIVDGFAALQDSSHYETLFQAAEARAAADWYVGLNATRALTCRYDAKLSAGRVQTPTLALLVRREEELEAFVGSFYWSLKADFGSFNATWYNAENSQRIASEEQALELQQQLNGGSARLSSVVSEEKSEAAPLPYDLTELQRDANLRLGFSAKKTLDVLQRLYEVHKIVTYPRTDSRYIGPDIVPTLVERLQALSATELSGLAKTCQAQDFSSAEFPFVSAERVGDHHALLPTEERVRLEVLSDDERSLWLLIARRFIEILMPPYRYRSDKIELEAAGGLFIARQVLPLDLGWKEAAIVLGERNEELYQREHVALDALSSGSDLPIQELSIKRTALPPPLRYSEATLLSAMEHAGRLVEDKELKQYLGKGLGTVATRADIIEKLLQNNYIERDGITLRPTWKGRELIRLVPALLREPELTAQWEQRLEQIVDGSEHADLFVAEMRSLSRQIVTEIVESKKEFKPSVEGLRTCPHCEQVMLHYRDELEREHYLCQRLSCSYEEMIVKEFKRTPTLPQGVKKVVKKSSSTVSSTHDTKRKKVVVRKTPAPEAIQWSEQVVVVTPSRYRRRHEPARHNLPKESGNVTFKDLLEESQRRQKERSRKR